MKKDSKLGVMSLMFMLFSGVALALGIHLFSAALTVAAASMMGLLMLWVRLPRDCKMVITWGPIRYTLDALVTFGAPIALAGTLTGAVSAIILGILLTLFLEFEYHRLRGHISFRRRGRRTT